MNILDETLKYDERIKKINLLLQNPEGRTFLKENFEKIKKLIINKPINIELKIFFDFIKKLENIPEFHDEYEEYSYWADLYNQIEIPEYEVADILDSFYIIEESEARKINLARMAQVVKPVVFRNILLSEDDVSRKDKSLILQEIANGRNYEFKSCGTTSLIIQTGDQIVKLGLERRKYEIPYHPRIMMPYFRAKYNDGSCIEVFNYGNVESAEITDEKVLEIYLELENAGIIWGDASKRNLVVLVKDNNLPDYIASKNFNVFGFLEDSRFPTDNHTALKAGDIVVCDLDMLYAKDDPECRYGDVDEVIEGYLMAKRMKIIETNKNLTEDDKPDR